MQLALYVAGLLICGALLLAQPRPATTDMSRWFDMFTARWLRADPSQATLTRYFTGAEHDRLARQLTPETLAYRRERITLARQGLAELRAFDRTTLSDSERVSADVLQWHLEGVIQQEPYLDYTFPLRMGATATNVRLVDTLIRARTIQTEQDAVTYVAALGQVGTRMQEAMAESQRLAARGFILPRFVLTSTIAQMRRFADTPAATSPYVTTLRQGLESIDGMQAGRREQLRAEAERLVTDDVYPTWRRAIVILESQLNRATDDGGMWRLPGGADAYASKLRREANTDLTPDALHEIGLKYVVDTEQQMDVLLRRRGLSDGSIKTRVETLRRRLAYPNHTSEESRAQIMRDIEGIARDAEARSELMFDMRPRAKLVIQPVPSFAENNMNANYQLPSPDGARPGIFRYPRRLEWMTTFRLKTVVYHEAVPGHHFQLAMQTENASLPVFRQNGTFGDIAASTEGWGMYAEQLVADAGWYGDDVEGLLGQLDGKLLRARRVVVDTGLHAKQWTLQQAVDYGVERSEIDAYISDPGRSSAYLIGALKITELREKTKAALGEKFSLRAFHNIILQAGVVPLPILERQVEAYIAAQDRPGVAAR